MPTGLRWWAVSDAGRFRKNNEDAFLCLRLQGPEVLRLGKVGEGTLETGDFIFAVSDGMGGANAGEFASRIATDKITQLLPRSFRMKASGLRSGGGGFLAEVFSRIHDELVRLGHAYEEIAGMGATLSLCWFTPERAHFCHVGDSRIYHLPEGGNIFQATHDHTHVGWLVRKGEITETEARNHAAKSALQMALGGQVQKLEPQTGQVRYEPGDFFVFCTDGITDGVSSAKILDLVRKPNPRTEKMHPAERLLDEARLASRDNMTAVVVEIL